MTYTYNKHEKLKSQKAIGELFIDGKSISAYPLRMVYKKHTEGAKVGVSVSKRFFKKAVDRNRIKRLLRESYRLNKNMLSEHHINSYSIMILYLNKEVPNFELINTKTQKLFRKFIALESE